MSVGFRKCLFGFHCDDVLDYIQQSQKRFADMQTDLSNQIDLLKKDLELSQENCRELIQEKDSLSEKLASFSEQYDEIQRLSENIGKLYLVAQANAQAIMENSEKSAALAQQEIEHNLATISQAQNSLDTLRKNVLATSQDFVNEIDSLLSSLNDTREQIADCQTDSDQHGEQFAQLYDAIVK